MIITGSFADLNNDYNEIYILNRDLSLFNKHVVVNDTSYINHCLDLCPSKELNDYILDLSKNNNFTEKVYFSEIVPTYLSEIKKSKNAKKQLNILYNKAKKQNILLFCYCENEPYCIRSVVAGLLYGAGSNIYSTQYGNIIKNEYFKYYNLYESLD